MTQHLFEVLHTSGKSTVIVATEEADDTATAWRMLGNRVANFEKAFRFCTKIKSVKYVGPMDKAGNLKEQA